ncbi:hypothetical protein PIB30_068039 [Stylosanthes scabra]|uniref:Uncharacterized protein n=1 Tax=Stylosanthes scabra TaxID=79078 RepID=A0ABU6VMY8_9FABA|nr:hypothetical protein [Stylosanthes scabra]
MTLSLPIVFLKRRIPYETTFCLLGLPPFLSSRLFSLTVCIFFLSSPGAKSIVDDEFVKYFCAHHEFCIDNVEREKYRMTAPSSEDRACYVNPLGVNCIFVYESIFTKIGVRVPFSEFQVEVLSEYELTKPFSKDKQQWLSLRAHQGRKVFEMNEESARDFKNLYFKVVPHSGTRPFGIDDDDEYRFPLSWNEDWVNPKVERNELSESELLFVDALSECWGKKDSHLPTRLLLTQPSSYIKNEILGIMSSKSKAYDRFKAHLLNKSKKPVTTGGSNSDTSKAVSPEVVPPTSSAIPDSSSARDTSATPSATHSPSIVNAQEVENRNREPPSSKAEKSKEFDHVGLAQEYLVGGSNKIPMDGENFMKNLDFVTRNCIKAAAICQAAQNKMKGSVLVPEGEVEQLRVRVKAVEIEKRVIEGEKFELSSMVSKLEARLALESHDLGVVREALKKLEKEKSEGDEKYRRLYAEFKLKVENQKKLEIELQAAQELCDKFTNDAMLLAEEVVENLKEQILVLKPNFDVSLIGPDNKVVDGVIVRPEPAADDDPILEEAVAGGSEQVPNAEGSPEAHPTMSDHPPTPPCHGI